MPQPIVIEYNGLARGIEGAGNAIGEALNKRADEKRQQERRSKSSAALSKYIENLGENASAIDIQKALLAASQDKDIDQDHLNETFKMFMPLYQERIKNNESMRYMEKVFPNSQMFQGQQSGNNRQQQPESNIGESEGILSSQLRDIPQNIQQDIPKLSTQSPMGSWGNQAMMSVQDGQMPLYQQQIQQEQQRQQIPQAIQEQQAPLINQQNQNIPYEEQKPSEKYTVEAPGLGEVSRNQIDALLMSPHESNRRVGESLDRQWLAKYKSDSKEATAIRTEYRSEIRKYAEPYQDLSKFETNINKLKEADKLIDSGNVSIDDQWLRTVITGIAEGANSPLTDIVKTKEQQKLWYLLRDSLKPKELGGTNPSTKEVLLAMGTLPSGYKTVEANKFIIQSMIKQAEIDKYKGQEISKLRRQNENISFPHFQQKLDESVNKYSSQKQKEFEMNMKTYEAEAKAKTGILRSGYVWMIDGEGNLFQTPKSDIKQAQASGGKLIREKK